MREPTKTVCCGFLSTCLDGEPAIDWSLYILDCGGRYYTGIAKDPERRFAQHAARSSRAARFTRAFPAEKLVYQVALGSRSLALRAEAAVKKCSRARKTAIINAAPSRQQLLAQLGLRET